LLDAHVFSPPFLFKLLIEQKTRFAVIIASAICFAALMAITPLILGWGLL
jgi:ATP-binding cassette subfamily B multidrug efflux pump